MVCVLNIEKKQIIEIINNLKHTTMKTIKESVLWGVYIALMGILISVIVLL